MKRSLLLVALVSAIVGLVLTGGEFVAAQVPISGLPAVSTPLAGSEVFPCVQSSTTDKCTINNIGSVPNFNFTNGLRNQGTQVLTSTANAPLTSTYILYGVSNLATPTSTSAAFATFITSTTLAGSGGGTGVNNGSDTISLGGSVSTTAAFSTTGFFNLNLTAAGAATDTVPAGTNTLAALNIANQVMAGGVSTTAFSIGTLSSGTTTINCGNGPLQYLTNNGAFGLTMSSTTYGGSCLVLIHNAASAGAISFDTGVFVVGANTGDSLTTTAGKSSIISFIGISSTATYIIKDLF